MAVGDTLGEFGGVIEELGAIGLWLQAVGVVIILWIIFQSIAFYLNRKRMKELYNIKDDVYRIERKIDRILKTVEK